MRRLLLLCRLGSAIVPIAGAACSVYDDSLLLHTDAGADVSSDAGQEARDGSDGADAQGEPEAQGDGPLEAPSDVLADVDPRACDPCKDPALQRPPCPGAGGDGPSGEPIVFAMRTLAMGLTQGADLNAWRAIGYDRDCLQTAASGEPMACLASEPLTMEDGESGRDNSFGRNIGGGLRLLSIQGLLPDLEAQGNARLTAGTWGWLLVVREYNGQDDDPLVRVAAHLSGGVTDAGTPVWDGTDAWSVESTSMQGGEPVYQDESAYASGGVIVAHFHGPMPFVLRGEGASLVLSLSDATVTMQLSPDRQRVVQGIVSAVSPLGEAIQAVDELAAQAGACPGTSENLDEARAAMLKTADVLMSGRNDPQAACDALSLGWTFTAHAARMGTSVEPVPIEVPSCAVDSGADAD